MKKEIDLWTQQSSIVKEKLLKEERTTVKKRYIKRKYKSEAEIFLTAYNFFVKEAKKIINKPEDAEYPIWAAPDRKNALSGGSGYLIKLKVPREKVILFDADKWNKILNLKYLPDNEKDLKDHKKMLDMYGIDSDSDIILSPHYPKLKEKIKNSWQKLFEDDISNIENIKAALWELRLEWVQDISEF